MKIKKSLQELYNEVNRQIEEMRQSILNGNGTTVVEDKTTEDEKVVLSDSREFRRLVFQELNK